MRKSISTLVKNMIMFFVLLVLIAVWTSGCKQQASQQESTDLLPKQLSVLTEQKFEGQIIEASCGQCQFGLAGKNCDLAVRIDGKAYFVDGTKIDEHGDAHADDGFCNAVRQARIHGRIEKTRFIVSSFELIPRG